MAASSITAPEFKDILSRYPAVLSSLCKPSKTGSLPLEELDKFRYEVAPSSFSKMTGRTMELEDVQKLLEWKMKHGTYRPTLASLVAKNSDEIVATATKDAFDYYATNPEDIKGVLEKLTTPLKGIGPATGSLILAIHDPQNVIYFSDELFRWLLHDGKRVTPKYTAAEFDDLFAKSKVFMAQINCTPIELEQVAFTIIKEAEPAHEPAPKKAPTGKPRGRPAMPESEKKKYVPTGLPRGRPSLSGGLSPAKDVGAITANQDAASIPKKRGRSAKVVDQDNEPAASEPKKRGRPVKVKKDDDGNAEPVRSEAKKRGRPAKAKSDSDDKEPAQSEPKKRGRPAKVKSNEEDKGPATPASNKRGRESISSTSSSKKQKI